MAVTTLEEFQHRFDRIVDTYIDGEEAIWAAYQIDVLALFKDAEENGLYSNPDFGKTSRACVARLGDRLNALDEGGPFYGTP